MLVSYTARGDYCGQRIPVLWKIPNSAAPSCVSTCAGTKKSRSTVDSKILASLHDLLYFSTVTIIPKVEGNYLGSCRNCSIQRIA